MIKALEKLGYIVIRIKGSHVRLKHPTKATVTVPLHKELGIGLTLKILKDAELSQEELKKLL
jgi:predicted RNA binding protein YcfA (HicA-like mRNA interferase family)